LVVSLTSSIAHCEALDLLRARPGPKLTFERPVIVKILTHLGLDPQPPPRGWAREARQDFAT
jgi:hypothetical protein